MVADLSDPTMPIVASVDTFGVANRVFLEGDRAYVTAMAGEGRASEVSVVDVRDPFRPELVRTIDLLSPRPDRVEDGAYDVTVSGGKAFVTVHRSDQEDRPSESLLEIVDLADDPGVALERAVVRLGRRTRRERQGRAEEQS